MKYVISWFERPQGSPIEYENIGVGGSLPFSHVAENRLATASMAVRSCFFTSLMRPYPWPATCAAFRAATWDLIAPHLQL